MVAAGAHDRGPVRDSRAPRAARRLPPARANARRVRGADRAPARRCAAAYLVSGRRPSRLLRRRSGVVPAPPRRPRLLPAPQKRRQGVRRPRAARWHSVCRGGRPGRVRGAVPGGGRLLRPAQCDQRCRFRWLRDHRAGHVPDRLRSAIADRAAYSGISLGTRAEMTGHGPVVVTYPGFDLEDERTAGALRGAGLTIRYEPRRGERSPADVARVMADASAGIVSTDPFDASVFAACPKLRVLARVGVGTDAIDLRAATRSGVAVTITPGANVNTVADHTLAMILACSRRW